MIYALFHVGAICIAEVNDDLLQQQSDQVQTRHNEIHLRLKPAKDFGLPNKENHYVKPRKPRVLGCALIMSRAKNKVKEVTSYQYNRYHVFQQKFTWDNEFLFPSLEQQNSIHFPM